MSEKLIFIVYEADLNAAMVETRDNSVGQVIDEARVVELPLNGRQAPDPTGKIRYGIPDNSTEHQIVSRVDWQQSANNSVFVRCFMAKYSHPASFTDNILLTSTEPGGAQYSNWIQSITFGDTFVITPTIISSTRVGFTRSYINRYVEHGVWKDPNGAGSENYAVCFTPSELRGISSNFGPLAAER